MTTRAASICGIDLGTTNSAVAVVVDGKPIIVADKDGNRTVPSVVSFAPDGTVLVGHDARRRLAKDPANTFSSVKRFIGKSFDSKTVKDDAKRVPYEVVAAPDGVGVALRSPAAGRDVTPIEVSQHIIATMLRIAEDGTDVPRGSIKRAVVTVPAYFDDAQCDATIAAGAPAKQAANWLTGDIMAYLKNAKDVTISTMPLRSKDLAEFCSMIENGEISGKIGKDILPDLLVGETGGAGPRAIVEERGLSQISDPAEIEAIVDKVLEENPGQLEQYRGGKDKLKGFFVGKVLAASGGRANPALSNQILMKKLAGE